MFYIRLKLFLHTQQDAHFPQEDSGNHGGSSRESGQLCCISCRYVSRIEEKIQIIYLKHLPSFCDKCIFADRCKTLNCRKMLPKYGRGASMGRRFEQEKGSLLTFFGVGFGSLFLGHCFVNSAM